MQQRVSHRERELSATSQGVQRSDSVGHSCAFKKGSDSLEKGAYVKGW
jgi:hypothetical protein